MVAKDMKTKRLLSKDEAAGYRFVLPAMTMLLAILIYPAADTFVSSFVVRLSDGGTRYALDNYIGLFGDSEFLTTFWNTLVFVGISVILHILVGLGIAMMLSASIRGRNWFRVIAILPWTIPDVSAAIVWKWIFNPLHGPLNDLLIRFGLISQRMEWLSNPRLALPAVIFANLWRGFPFVMLILLAGLQSIPQNLYEAASVDGANWFQEFLYITLPSLSKMFAVAFALDTVWEFRRFGLVQVMTGGGPGSTTEILSTLIYKQYFKFFNFEYAASMAVFMTIILLVISLPYIQALLKET
jgi:multiple sugar transport system permease protein